MSIKYILALILALTGFGLAILLIIFLMSAALFGSLFLPIICIISMVAFFGIVSMFNKNNKS